MFWNLLSLVATEIQTLRKSTWFGSSKYFGCVLNILFTRNASVSTQKCKHSCLPGLLFVIIFNFKDQRHKTTKSVKFERKFWNTDQTNQTKPKSKYAFFVSKFQIVRGWLWSILQGFHCSLVWCTPISYTSKRLEPEMLQFNFQFYFNFRTNP